MFASPAKIGRSRAKIGHLPRSQRARARARERERERERESGPARRRKIRSRRRFGTAGEKFRRRRETAVGFEFC